MAFSEIAISELLRCKITLFLDFRYPTDYFSVSFGRFSLAGISFPIIAIAAPTQCSGGHLFLGRDGVRTVSTILLEHLINHILVLRNNNLALGFERGGE